VSTTGSLTQPQLAQSHPASIASSQVKPASTKVLHAKPHVSSTTEQPFAKLQPQLVMSQFGAMFSFIASVHLSTSPISKIVRSLAEYDPKHGSSQVENVVVVVVVSSQVQPVQSQQCQDSNVSQLKPSV